MLHDLKMDRVFRHSARVRSLANRVGVLVLCLLLFVPMPHLKARLQEDSEPTEELSTQAEAPDSDETASEEPIEEILVIGTYRRSLREALNEKRDASEIIEALSAADIGELPDTSVAESLARLPGVSYTRNAFGANNISIRGLGAVLTSATLNDRDLASEWGDRSVAYNLFPAELISRASVYKAPSASHVEGGIGGTVDLRTARPLEWDARALAFNFRTRYNDLAPDLPNAESVGYRGSLSYVDQFNDDTLGIALGYAAQYSPLLSADSYIYESRTVAYGGFIEGIPAGLGDTNDFNIPYGAETGVFNGTSLRHSLLTAVQWQPIDALEIYFDGFLSKLEQDNTAVGLALGDLGTFANAYSDVKVDGFHLIGATTTCTRTLPNECRERRYGQDLRVLNAIDDGDSELGSLGLGAAWSGGALTLNYDLSFSRAKGDNLYHTVGYRPYHGPADAPELVRPISRFGENEDGAAFLTSPLDFTDLSTARIDSLRLIEGDREDEIVSFKADARYEFESSPLSSLRLGLRLVNRDNTLVRKDNRVQVGSMNPVPVDTRFVQGVFDQSRVDSVFDANPILVLDAQAVRDSLFAGIEAETLNTSSHFIEEDVLAYYTQLDFAAELLGVPMDGNIGVRVVSTNVNTQGAASVEGVEAPVATSDDYTEVLPSANINLYVATDTILRLAASRVLARPAINFLSPGTETYGNEIFGGVEGGGNPFLRPFVARQFDLSVERYIGADSAVAVAVFYKDMETFITQDVIRSGPPDNSVSYIPANGEGGRILGAEITFQHTFSGLLPEAYGDVSVYATYTYTDSNIELSESFNSSTFGLDGQSDHIGNLTLSYYQNRFGARVSYRYRSDFTRPQRPARAFTTNSDEGDLSFQVSYDPTDNLRLFFEGWGLLDEPRDNYYGLKSLQGHYGLFGRSIQLGASYRM